MRAHLSLKDVSRLLGLKPYRIAYAISVGLIPEPACRVGNKRVFRPKDVERIANHFGISIKDQ